MNKIKLKLRSSLLSVTAFISLFSLTPQPVYAQTISPTLGFWNKIFKPSRRDPEPPIKPLKGTSRPGKPICLISPDAPSQTRIIWNTKPFFLWKGDINKVYAKTLLIIKIKNKNKKNNNIKKNDIGG